MPTVLLWVNCMKSSTSEAALTSKFVTRLNTFQTTPALFSGQAFRSSLRRLPWRHKRHVSYYWWRDPCCIFFVARYEDELAFVDKPLHQVLDLLDLQGFKVVTTTSTSDGYLVVILVCSDEAFRTLSKWRSCWPMSPEFCAYLPILNDFASREHGPVLIPISPIPPLLFFGCSLICLVKAPADCFWRYLDLTMPGFLSKLSRWSFEESRLFFKSF